MQHFSPADLCPERLRFLDRVPDDQIGNYRFYSGHYFFDQLERIPQPRRAITLLRDPRKRLLSLYYFFRAHTWEHIGSLERIGVDSPRLAKELHLLAYLRRPDFLVRQYAHNAITRHLIGLKHIGSDGRLLISNEDAFATAISNLQRISAFGVVERYSEARARFAAVLGFDLPEQLPIVNRFDELADLSTCEPIERHDSFDQETEAEIERNIQIDRRIYGWAVNNSAGRSNG